jgi:RHS repeat-associated protein
VIPSLPHDGQLNPVAELDGSGQVVSRFVYASKANVPDYMVSGGVTYRLISDHLGSVRLVVNASTAAVAQRIDYDEFGNVLADTSPGFQPFGFAGGLYDPDTGLVRFGARDYDPATGRWTAKDPLGFKGGDSNVYGYVSNDPVNAFDPAGKDWQLAGALTAVGVSSILAGTAISYHPAHIKRNRLNHCPVNEPNELIGDCTGRIWTRDWYGSGKYRAQDGSECTYSGGTLTDAGTFNYGPGDPIWPPNGRHWVMDLLPGLATTAGIGGTYSDGPQRYSCP